MKAKFMVSLMGTMLALVATSAAVHAGSVVPPECVGLASSDYIVIEENQMNLITWAGYSASVVADSEAMNGFAALNPGGNGAWLIQYHFTTPNTGLWHAYAHIKYTGIDINDTTFTGLAVGGKDIGGGPKQVWMDGIYHTIDYGVADLSIAGDNYFWAQAPNHTTENQYVDSFVLVKDGAVPAVPEPSSILALASGLGGLLMIRRRSH